ncbi:AAA family ATPase [Pseudomonas sp. LT1P18]|uniref:AAA family ATPase n=1 Tax=Pseudomonas arabinosi TaxID=3398357 RepID=UPI0039F082CB
MPQVEKYGAPRLGSGGDFECGVHGALTFDPPANQPDRSKGVCYYYIGLKNRDKANTQLKATADLCTDFIDSFNACFNQARKRKLWLASVEKLNFDINFKEIGLLELITFINDPKFESRLKQTYLRMSSGHAIVLLTLTNIIANIEEKSLILIDEPESHLHPPLLSAFTRTLSDLLIERNGVAIIATHSPVVLQEVPKSCVWKLYRVRLESTANRPQDETFGENVGTLTREVFGLEVSNSGFHALLRQSVSEKKTYEQIIEEYKGQLGYEGRSILRSLISPSLKGDEKTS